MKSIWGTSAAGWSFDLSLDYPSALLKLSLSYPLEDQASTFPYSFFLIFYLPINTVQKIGPPVFFLLFQSIDTPSKQLYMMLHLISSWNLKAGGSEPNVNNNNLKDRLYY